MHVVFLNVFLTNFIQTLEVLRIVNFVQNEHVPKQMDRFSVSMKVIVDDSLQLRWITFFDVLLNRLKLIMKALLT